MADDKDDGRTIELVTAADVAPVESKIVSAVGIAATGQNRDLAKRIEAAMQKAVLAANEEGISTADENSNVLRERMMAARQQVLDEEAVQTAMPTHTRVPEAKTE